MDSDIRAFGAALARQQLTETKLAVALLWYFEEHRAMPEVPSQTLATALHELSLTGPVNISRLRKNLTRAPGVVAGREKGTFKIRLSHKDSFDADFGPHVSRPKVKVEDHVLAAEDFEGTRTYLEKLVNQINGCYQFQFYDACAVLCRRLAESLLISAFEQNGKGAIIKSGKDYVTFGDMIGLAQSGQHIKLARSTADALTEAKDKGDTAAHSPNYIAKDRDIDDMKFRFRRAVADLMHVGKIERRGN